MTLQKIFEKVEALERTQADLFMRSTLNKEYLTLKEAAAYLSVGMDKMYELTQAKVFSVYKPGGKIAYIKRADLNEWIEAAKIPSAAEIDTQTNSLLLKKRRA